MTTTLLLADDHRMVREGLRALLQDRADFQVVAEADNGRDAVRLATEFEPDVVVMDVAMPGLNGVEATRQILALRPGIRILGLSMHADRRYVARLLKAGGSGYLLKDDAADELTRAIRTLALGGVYLSRRLERSVLRDYVSRLPDGVADEASPLTPREHEVLQLLAEGNPVRAIAGQLHISPKTVETHRRRLMIKLDLRSVAELTKYAVREGLTSIDR